MTYTTYGPLAQRLEQSTHNRLVAGSNPARATNNGGSRITVNMDAILENSSDLRSALSVPQNKYFLSC